MKSEETPAGIPGQIAALFTAGLREFRVSKSESLKYRSRKSHFSICHIKEKGEHANWLVIFSLNNRWPLSHSSRQSGRCCLPASSLGPTRSGLQGSAGGRGGGGPTSSAASSCIQPHPHPPASEDLKSLPFLSRSLSSGPSTPTCPALDISPCPPPPLAPTPVLTEAPAWEGS